jgi:hypothetical protein
MPGSFGAAVTTVNFALSGSSTSSGTISLSVPSAYGSFANFGFARGAGSTDPWITHLIAQSVDVSSSSNFVRVSTTATAPVAYAPYPPRGSIAGRAFYSGISVTETGIKANGTGYIDHAQVEMAASNTLLPAAAEGYDDGLLYDLEPGVGALWERSQAHTYTGRYSGHFLASPAYVGNSYQRIAGYPSYNSLLAAFRTYADVLQGPN